LIEHFSAGVTALGANFDHIIRILYDFEVVFNDDDCVSVVNEAMEEFDESLDIGEVESDRGFL
jgi:hypothetical protein